MRHIHPAMLAEEDLPAPGEIGRGSRIAAIDHAARGDRPPVLHGDPIRGERQGARIEMESALRKQSAQARVEIPAVERAVIGGEMPGEFGKADLVSVRPCLGPERAHQRVALRPQIAVEPAPAVIASEDVACLDQRDLHGGVRAMRGKGNQATGQSAADDSEIDGRCTHRLIR